MEVKVKEDYYQTLEVAKGADEASIKKAYRKLAMKFHPDRNKGDKKAEEKFKKISEAYEVLSNSQKRAAYDQYGHAAVDGSAGGGGGHHNAQGFGDIFEDIFGDIFGKTQGGGANQRSSQESFKQAGADLRYNLSINLEKAVRGTTVEIKVPTYASCKPCAGSGAKPGSKPSTCNTCGGVGQVRMQQGFFAIQQVCPKCQGSGHIISNPCQPCRGQGRVHETKTLSVKVPAGVDTGDRIRLSGEGEAGINGGPAGDLYVQMQVKEHDIFKRDGKDLYCEVPIDFITASLGGELDVPSLEGKIKLHIPPETQTGRVFRLRGKGVKPVRSHQVGDLLCKVCIETPVNLSQTQKEILQNFGKSLLDGKDKHSPRSTSWFDKVKSFFEEI